MDTTTSIKMTTLAIQNLFSYVEEENLPALRAHLDRFKEVDGRSDNGQTPLMVAAEQGSMDIVSELIRRGANVNLDDVDCWSALICAAKEGHLEVVKELLENSAYIEHRDMGGWTALMWAAYKGREEVTKVLLEHGANPNTTGQQYSVYPIIWAAGRGHAHIIKLLLSNGAKVNCSDKYGTTPLIWASRKGHFDCVTHLLENGADVDQEGANSMTALIVAVRGGYTAVVKELLKRNPNVNMTDKDGNTALMIAAKEGYTEIVQDLLDAGTYVNIPDRSGDTVLIGAVRGGHTEIVRALLQKYADIDIRGQENKTALYWAVEKGNATMVRDILQCNPDTETCTKDGETPLIKATKMRNIEVVELLLDKGAKVSAVDKKGDTPLHIAIRGRSRRLAELLLRNPKDGRLLYRPNRNNDTPYNIDCSHQKSILTQIFGARHLSPSETDGDIMGYDLYSSALADILSEPTMQPPICVGLYAQWGSGKSFLLRKLEDEMKTFAGQQVEPLFHFSWLVVFLSVFLCMAVGVVLGVCADPKLALSMSLSLLALLYLFFVVVYFGGRREGDGWTWAWLLSTRLARHLGYLELLLKLMFVNPPELPEQSTRALPVRFLFTDYNRLSSVGGETSMAEMIATLSDACEREFGFLATRLFRVFKTEEAPGKRKWKQTCCVPSILLFLVVGGCLLSGLALLAVFRVGGDNGSVRAALVGVGGVVGLALLLNCRTWFQVTDSVLNSQRKRLHSAANRLNKLKSEGFMKVLKQEVELMARMAKTIDSFTEHQTRLTVVIDGLDSCEQDKVLQMLDTVRVLFSKGPFVSIFASDPHIIIKAINQSLSSVLRDANINGHDYMRNIVHLPVFLNSRGLSGARKVATGNHDDGWQEELDRKLSLNSLGEITKFGSKSMLNRRDTQRRRTVQRSVTRQMSFDLKQLMVSEDWFTDISPQTMRRLLHIVSVTGRLLRANQISFNWDRLASWINLTEQWPYRTSWILLFLEENDSAPDSSLKSIYERVLKNIPTSKEVEPLLEIDSDVRSFEVFLSSRTPVLTARDVKTFLHCTVNLDPKLREIIADVRAAREQVNVVNVGGASVQPRPPSLYSQASSFVPPAGGALSPHCYSGLVGAQHPFYNRPYFPPLLYQPPPFTHQHPPIRARAAVSVVLSSLSTEGVCERVQQIEGIDQSMTAQYSATIRKANINGHVLSQCNIDDLKKEMNMNFGDWQLFRATVLDLRQVESQLLLQDDVSERGSVLAPPTVRHSSSVPLSSVNADVYNFNLSFEDLDEPTRLPVGPWTGGAQRTTSMNSLNSQESSNDIVRLTDRQQAEYRSAYQDYIAQMAQVDAGGAGERPVQPQPGHFLAPPEDRGKEEPDARKAFSKRSGVKAEGAEPGGEALDPITEEDEKGEHGLKNTLNRKGEPKLKVGGGLRYQKLASDDESEESDKLAEPMKGKDFLSDVTLDKKDSSDSGVRSNESSPNHSLQDEEAELLAVGRNLQDPAVTRMSICSEDRVSLLASSPEDGWPRPFNLNYTPSSVTLNNNTNRQPGPASTAVIVPPDTTRPTPNNENVRVVHLRRSLKPGDPPRVCTVTSDAVTFSEERESIL
ncbi:kinase D-interacting substrate of 220 kDa B isoform X2 [Gouania willdenowi]|uniref:Kinase D-interacting substrate of 220 kDa B-like n=1 Tax=Gouania willdenowi TaxID=441366 RepID=A0A8C5GXQ8_GOUWI|nr:kinase D-interacting substrate of 220 kDa B-like isoform X2 [Gouania willdenowi]